MLHTEPLGRMRWVAVIERANDTSCLSVYEEQPIFPRQIVPGTLSLAYRGREVEPALLQFM